MNEKRGAHQGMLQERVVKENPGVFKPGFDQWLRDNWIVWLAFEREANRVWNRGRRHYSARTIIEFLRHETTLADTGPDFKINGNNVPDLARLYQVLHPERADLFETRGRR